MLAAGLVRLPAWNISTAIASTAAAAVRRRQQFCRVRSGDSAVSTIIPLHDRRIKSFVHNALSCRTVDNIGAHELCAFDKNSKIVSMSVHTAN